MDRTRRQKLQIDLRMVVNVNLKAKVQIDALTILELIAEIDRLEPFETKHKLNELSGKSSNPSLADIFGGIFK